MNRTEQRKFKQEIQKPVLKQDFPDPSMQGIINVTISKYKPIGAYILLYRQGQVSEEQDVKLQADIFERM